MSCKAKNPKMKDLPWFVLDICPRKLPKMEGVEVVYATMVPSGPTIVQNWKCLVDFLDTRSGYDQVVGGWMNDVNVIGNTAFDVVKYMKISNIPFYISI